MILIDRLAARATLGDLGRGRVEMSSSQHATQPRPTDKSNVLLPGGSKHTAYNPDMRRRDTRHHRQEATAGSHTCTCRSLVLDRILTYALYNATFIGYCRREEAVLIAASHRTARRAASKTEATRRMHIQSSSIAAESEVPETGEITVHRSTKAAAGALSFGHLSYTVVAANDMSYAPFSCHHAF